MIDPLNPGRTIAPGLAALLAVFVAGLVAGKFYLQPGGIFMLGLGALGILCGMFALLQGVADKTRRRVTGDASYRAFFDHAVDGIFRTTTTGRYLAANQALCDIYGYIDPDELIEGFTDIGAQLYVDPGRREEFRALIQANGLVTNFVSEIRHRSGRRLWISENARAIRDWSGILVCYEGTVEDVTEKLETERTLRAALRQAEIANRTKAAFLAAMSHELKTPLNAVLGFSEIIRDEVMGPAGVPAYRDYAGDIHRGGSKLLAVINDVLDVSRLEGGLLTIEMRPENVLDIAEVALKLARGVVNDIRSVEVDVPVGMPSLLIDPRRMAQALGNLLANALKFTPEGGKIRLVARPQADGGMHLLVEDTGIGMAEETMAAAMESFRQLDHSLARRFEGAGLGLSIAKALVELHGGALSLKSKIGQGTTVTIALPPSCVMRQPSSAKVA
ncbi:MAG TPA: PAS domain-containing sensor histidine kinase [Rhizomicrobium sp.]|nr:PAS domain-containing sensor histidine kinase [Rhizomicrobium sp.]